MPPAATDPLAFRVVIAPDKFKGSLSAAEVAARVATGFKAVADDLGLGVDLVQAPIADGGEGTLEAALVAGFRRVTARVSGPTGQPLDASFAVRDATAVVEMAVASGLSVLPGGDPAPLRATSLGTGQLIGAALDEGCTEVILGVGGSACTDGGAGLLTGLGARLIADGGGDLDLGGAALAALDRVDLAGLDPRLQHCRVVLAGDVDNPLLGPTGAAAVYGPQKGADPAAVATLETGLTRWVAVLAAALGPPARTAAEQPGAGAAGGVGYAALAALNATRRPGIDVVLEFTGAAAALAGARLAVTGEGSLDPQTLHGKAPAGLAAAARAAGVPAVAVAGRCLLDRDELAGTGLLAAYALTDIEPDVRECQRNAGPLLERLSEQVAREWLVTGRAE